MNYEQLMLLKLSEEVGEIATALLEPLEKNPSITGFNQFSVDQLKELHCELNDFYAVVHILNDAHRFEYFYPKVSQALMPETVSEADFNVWINKTALSCLNVSKLVSKTMQFGLFETQPELTKNNCERTHDAIDSLRLSIEILNSRFGLGFEVNDEQLCAKVEKIYKFAGYSERLGMLMDYHIVKVDRNTPSSTIEAP